MHTRSACFASALLAILGTGCSDSTSDSTGDGAATDASSDSAESSDGASAPDSAGSSDASSDAASQSYYYVATTGSDSASNDGSSLHPWLTISYAAKHVSAGATVHVLPGTYAANVATSVSGTSSARIRFLSTKQFGAVIVGTGTEAMWLNTGDWVDIVGFDVSGSGRLGIQNEGSNVRIMGNHVHNLKVSGGCTNNGGAGIDDSNYRASDDDIIGNIVHDVGVPGTCNTVQGIYHSNLRGHILNNIVYRSAAWGIHLWHAANAVIIANNDSFANGGNNNGSCQGGGMVVGDGDSCTGAPGCPTSGTYLVADNMVIANNIVFGNPCSSIREYCYSGENCIGTHNKYVDNLVNGNGSGIVLLVGSPTGTQTGAPAFVSYNPTGSGKYDLQATSPAIDKGTSVNAPAIDIVGGKRPQGAAFDIGAYEHGAAPGTWPWF